MKLILTLVLALTSTALLPQSHADFAGTPSVASKMRAHAFRLKPGQDFMIEIRKWAREHKIKAASIISVVGSFKKVNLRYANQENGTAQEGFFEIVSMVGTFDDTSEHLHASVSNGKGETFGGHLLTGNIVYTTADVVVAELEDAKFSREHDAASGWDELVVRTKK